MSHFIEKAAARILLDRVGQETLGQRSVLARNRNNLAKIEESVQQRSRVVLISPLGRWKEGMDLSEAVPLADRQVFTKVWMSRQGQTWEQTQRDFPYALEAWRRGDTIMAIALAHPYPFKRAGEDAASSWSCQVVSLALMPVTEEWIPYANEAERLLLLKLKSAGRSFTKPLAFDAGPTVLFPSVILHDCEEASLLPMEIMNLAGPIPHGYADFRQRYFSNGFGVDSWWTWNLRNSPNEIPKLPPQRQRKPKRSSAAASEPANVAAPAAPDTTPDDPYSGIFI